MSGPVAPVGRPAAAPAQTAERAKMQQAAKQFEAVFARQMIGSMRQAGLAEGVFDSSATGQFRDMADAKTADAMADTGGLGIARMLMRQYDAGHAAQAGTAPAKIEPPAKASADPAVDSGK